MKLRGWAALAAVGALWGCGDANQSAAPAPSQVDGGSGEPAFQPHACDAKEAADGAAIYQTPIKGEPAVVQTVEFDPATRVRTLVIDLDEYERAFGNAGYAELAWTYDCAAPPDQRAVELRIRAKADGPDGVVFDRKALDGFETAALKVR